MPVNIPLLTMLWLEPGELVRRGEGVVGASSSLSRWQVEVLEGLYRRSTKVSERKVEVVARHLSLDPDTVTIWFQSRQADDKVPLNYAENSKYHENETGLVSLPSFDVHIEGVQEKVKEDKETEDERFLDQECGKQAEVKESFEIVNKERDAKLQKCSFCGKVFISKSFEFKNHVRRHTNGKSHKCQKCDFSTFFFFWPYETYFKAY